jgi:ATP-dependent Lon protease
MEKVKRQEHENNIVTSRELPLIPLRGLTIFPYMVLHFDVGRERSINALEEAMVNDQLVFLASQKEAEVNLPTPEDFYQVGTVSKIKQMLKLPGDTIRVLVEGISRARIKSIVKEEPYFMVEVEEEHYSAEIENDKDSEALMRSVMEAFEQYIEVSHKISPEVLVSIAEIEMPGRMADTISANLTLKQSQKQEILEAFEPHQRLETLYKILLEEIEILEI